MRAAAAPETSAPALPPLFRHHVRRPRLTRLLDASTSRLIAFTAPAGYGKTTLAAEWLQGRPEEEVAWYYASTASADVAALSVGIAEAVSHILPAGDRVRQRLRVPQVPDNNAEILAELLAADLMSWPEKAWLVLDDYHLAMESKSAERFVEELVRLAPIRLLITTRRRPTWVTARRVVYGEVLEVRREQLAMTDAESAAVLVQGDPAVRAEKLPPEAWPALVGLAVMAEPTPDETNLEGELFQYFADEVLRLETPERRRFLLTAAVAPYVTSDLAALLPTEVHPSVIADYVESGLLRKEAADRACFHPLLRDFFRKELEKQDAALARTVGETVFAHLLDTAEWDGALGMAAELGEPNLVVSAYARASGALLKQGWLDTLERAALSLTPDLQRTPEVALARAEVALRQGRFRDCAALSRYVAEQSEPVGSRAARAWVLHGRARHLMSEHHAALDAYDRANAATDDEDVQAQVVWGRFIVASELGLGDLPQRLNDYALLPAKDANSRLRLAAGTMLVSQHEGRGDACRKAMRDGLALAPLADDPLAISHMLVVSVALGVAGGEYAEALERAESACTYCRSLRLDFAYTYSVAYRAGAEIGLRRMNEARQSLAEVAKDPLLVDDSHLALLLSILTAKKLIAAGKIEQVSNRCPSLDFDDIGALPAAQAGELLALEALAHAATGRIEESEARAAEARGLTSDRTPLLYAKFASLINLCRQNPLPHNLAENLAEAIGEAAGSFQLDVFVNAYRAWPSLLAQVPDHPRTLSLARRTLKAARDEPLVARLDADTATLLSLQEAHLNLTPREVEVASLLAQGLSNAEIATRLFIAHSTAKVHVRHVLKKLGASSRVEAALRWKEFV